MSYFPFIIITGLRMSKTKIEDIKALEKGVERYLASHVSKDLSYRMISSFKFNQYYINHIVINNNGIFIINIVDVIGDIHGSMNDKYWEVNNTRFDNPILLSDIEAEKIREILDDRYVIYPIILLANPNNMDHLIDNVLTINELPSYLDTYKGDRKYDRSEVIEIYQKLCALYYKKEI